MSDAQEKTEQATPKRMKEVHGKGKLTKSQDATVWVGMGVAALALPATVAAGTSAATEQVLGIAAAAASPSTDLAMHALQDGLGSLLGTLATILVAAFVAVLVMSVVQGGVHLRTQFTKYEQFNPVLGLKNTFGMQALWQGAKALLKTLVVGGVLYFVVIDLMPVLMTSGGLSIEGVLDAGVSGVTVLLIAAVVAGLVLAGFDILVVGRRNRKQTRMTKREVQDETKSSDGDPHIRAQRRSRQLAMSRNRMMAAVADSSVVLVNPTEYAVALRYEPGKSAPRVVAKGRGIIAANIRAEADKASVPLVKDVPLTRALHAACDLGDEIPVEFYGTVATVLTFVAALTQRGTPKGVHTVPAPSLRRHPQ
jgi:flagellar biosynthetic protein FlhB